MQEQKKRDGSEESGSTPQSRKLTPPKVSEELAQAVQKAAHAEEEDTPTVCGICWDAGCFSDDKRVPATTMNEYQYELYRDSGGTWRRP